MRTLGALLFTGLAVLAVLSIQKEPAVDAPWRACHENSVRAAVMRDLVDVADEVPEHRSMALCLSLWTGTGTHSQGEDVDPPAALLAAMTTVGRPVYRISDCTFMRLMYVDPHGGPALKLSVSALNWASHKFVKTEGYWLRGALNAVGYRYTVSLVDGTWRVDTAHFDWIS